jgi:anthranilate phosphoribosyltransferase
VVLANAAMGLHATGKYGSYEDAYGHAVESLDSGRAYAALQKLIALQS